MSKRVGSLSEGQDKHKICKFDQLILGMPKLGSFLWKMQISGPSRMLRFCRRAFRTKCSSQSRYRKAGLLCVVDCRRQKVL